MSGMTALVPAGGQLPIIVAAAGERVRALRRRMIYMLHRLRRSISMKPVQLAFCAFASTTRASLAVLRLAAILVIVSATIAYPQTSQRSEARSPAAPSFESFKQMPLPRGFFKGWCGSNDQVLLEADRKWQIFDLKQKSSKTINIPSTDIQCSSDGRRLVFVNDRLGVVSELDSSNGETRILAYYERDALSSSHFFVAGSDHARERQTSGLR